MMLRTIFYICGFYKLSVVQKGDIEKEKDAPIYIFAPHTSLFDVLAGIAFNAPSSVAKADIVDIPLFGSMCPFFPFFKFNFIFVFFPFYRHFQAFQSSFRRT